MTGSIHVWPGVADAGLATSTASLTGHTLVARADSGATGFDRDPVGKAALLALDRELHLLRGETGAAERIDDKADPVAVIRAATRPRAWVTVAASEPFEALRSELADYRKALAKKALTERLGKPFVAPPAPALLGLFDDAPSEASVHRLASACEAVLVFRFAGEWGIAATLLATGDQGELAIARLGHRGVQVVRAESQRDLPMW
jgi:hypothetical protein